MALQVRLVRDLDVTVMELKGRVTLGEGAVSYRDALRDAVWNGHRKLALDYGEMSYQDSSGFGEMITAFTIVANSGGQMVLFDLTKRVHDLFQITKLYSVFQVFDSRDAAVAYFNSTRDPEIQVTENRYLDVSVLLIEGALTEKSGAVRVRAAVENALSAGAESVILLCPQILEIDRAGVENLVAARRDVRAGGGDLALAGVEERLMLAMSDADGAHELPVYETIDAALGAFGVTVRRSRGQIEVARAG